MDLMVSVFEVSVGLLIFAVSGIARTTEGMDVCLLCKNGCFRLDFVFQIQLFVRKDNNNNNHLTALCLGLPR